MATYQAHKDELVTCPYEANHRVKGSRYQLHLAKCRQNHLSEDKDICPFNAQHRCNKGELQHHLLQCPDRAPLDRQLIASATSDNTYRGHVGVPSYHSQETDVDENWDNEINPNCITAYEPKIEPPRGGVRINFDGMKESQRKQYYRNLHHKDYIEENEDSEKTVCELRKPKTVSQAQLLEQRKPVHELQNIGLGRGQPAGSTRIAANIYGQQPPTIRQPKSAPNIPGFQALGMGRGNPVVNGDLDVGLEDMMREIENIPLGRGRGGKKPKS